MQKKNHIRQPQGVAQEANAKTSIRHAAVKYKYRFIINSCFNRVQI
ncbi:MAG: hypothetical protein LBJ23_03390 [Tannerella sp.]|nr:hypothetical protein [Tannerella sp.]